MTNLNWDDLRVFLTVARAGSIRGAAREIGKTHATVSRHIQSLQAALGSPLLERRKEGQCLTELGKRVLPLAEQVKNKVAEIDRAAFSADTGLAGSVKLSLSESLYLALLFQPIDDFMTRYPMIDLDIRATDALSKLGWREADVVVRITKSPPDTAFGKKVADSPLAVYASPHYLENRPKMDRWITTGYAPAREPVIPARIVATADAMTLSAKMIQMGQGVGMLPCYMGDTDPKLTRLWDVDPVADMQIWVLTHDDLRANPRVRALMDHLYRAFADIRPIIEGKSVTAKG
ncbi:MAG: LysR family transcriptional regulator [Marinosulfonomonas sp.]|nr:LysR family transcriptional regulator [Marinosulfonomonas sp.]